MDILISGAGIAGPTLAWWLLEYGFRPVLVETSPRLRTGGYVIDFWGKGFDIAERMGLKPELMEQGYRVREVRFVDGKGQRIGGFPVNVFDRATHGRFTSLPRSALAAAISGKVMDRAGTIFGDRVLSLEEAGKKVKVGFEHAGVMNFDLVIGADGVHSGIRELAFGPEAGFETFLGYNFAAFVAEDYAPRDTDMYIAYSQPGKQAARFAMRDGSTLILLIYEDDKGIDLSGGDGKARDALHAQFDQAGWECAAMLEALEGTDDLYIDRTSQIRLDHWSKGRVALVGDAAYGPSFMAGQGSALAMIGAYVLAGELKNAWGDHGLAFSRYEKRLAPFMRKKQKSAARFASSLVPRTRLGIGFRNLVSHAMSVPLVADWAMGPMMRDEVKLPDY